MSTIIRLDTNAMNVLFPEGTEARVKLQQAVLQSVADSFIKARGDEVIDELSSSVISSLSRFKRTLEHQAKEMIIEKVGDVSDFGHHPEIVDELKDKLEDGIEHNLKRLIRDISHEQIREVIAENIHAEKLEVLANTYIKKYCKEAAVKVMDQLARSE